jgi:hypothetical protein
MSISSRNKDDILDYHSGKKNKQIDHIKGAASAVEIKTIF